MIIFILFYTFVFCFISALGIYQKLFAKINLCISIIYSYILILIYVQIHLNNFFKHKFKLIF